MISPAQSMAGGEALSVLQFGPGVFDVEHDAAEHLAKRRLAALDRVSFFLKLHGSCSARCPGLDSLERADVDWAMERLWRMGAVKPGHSGDWQWTGPELPLALKVRFLVEDAMTARQGPMPVTMDPAASRKSITESMLSLIRSHGAECKATDRLRVQRRAVSLAVQDPSRSFALSDVYLAEFGEHRKISKHDHTIMRRLEELDILQDPKSVTGDPWRRSWRAGRRLLAEFQLAESPAGSLT